MEIRYSYRDAPTIKAFSESGAFIRGLMGPFRSGKSSGCIVEIVRRGLAQKPGPDGKRRTRWIVVRNTYGQLRDSTIKTFHAWFPPAYFGEYRSTEHDYLIKAFEDTEIEVMFRALDRPDHVANLLSLEVTGAYVNEAREVPWAIIDALQGRVGQYPSKREGGCTWAGLFMDTNPPDVDSKWYRFFEETKHPESFAQLFKQPSGLAETAENLAHLNGGRLYYERLSQGKDAEWIKVYVKGEYGFVLDGRPIYPEYDDYDHFSRWDTPELEPRTDPNLPIYRGWDFGLTPACIFAQLLPTGTLIVVDELCADDMGVERFADEVITHSSLYYPDSQFEDIGDPAGMNRSQTDEKTCFLILAGKGIDIQPGEQTPTLRWESVRRPLNRRGGFRLHKRCVRLRKGFQGGYHFRRLQVSADRYSDKPEKNIYSHPHDGLQYLCTRIYGHGLTTPRERQAGEDDEFVFANETRSPVTGY